MAALVVPVEMGRALLLFQFILYPENGENLSMMCSRKGRERGKSVRVSRMASIQGNNPSTPDSVTGKQDNIRAFLLNTRSLNKHDLHIFDLIQESKSDILFLTKTWLTENSNSTIAIAIPPGYSILRKDRIGARGVESRSLVRMTSPLPLYQIYRLVP